MDGNGNLYEVRYLREHPAAEYQPRRGRLVWLAVSALALLACGGCCSITVRTSGNGSVSVHQTRVVNTDASIPASLK